MPIALEQFVRQLEDSGIVAPAKIREFLPPVSEPKDAAELARALIRSNHLTKYQAEQIVRGKGKSLFLGNYVLLDKIGQGGMGQVYKAEHRRMARVVAIKILPAEVTKDPASIARFEREVRTAAKLDHPNIVTAYDADQADGVHFLVMQFVDGSDLSVLVKRDGPFGVDESVDYILQAARGLEAAHADGVVHRDIKPANLLLDKKGTIKILDMGLARIQAVEKIKSQSELTSTGTVMGTVDFMAPEQAVDAKSADARADIYSLGCTLYYLLTGKATYEGDTLVAKLLAHRDKPIPSLRAARDDIPEPLDAIFRKMIAKDVGDRYQTMTDVISALSRMRSGGETVAEKRQPPRSAVDPGLTSVFGNISIEEPQSLVPKKAPRPPREVQIPRWAFVAAGVLVFASIVAGIVATFRTTRATIVVEVFERDVAVEVLDAAGKPVETKPRPMDPGDDGTFSVPAGKGLVRARKEGFELFTEPFEIRAGEKITIPAHLVRSLSKASEPANRPPAWESPEFQAWMMALPVAPEPRAKAVGIKLSQLNHGFDGRVTYTITQGNITDFGFNSDAVTDVSPVRALTGLEHLSCNATTPGKSRLSDLTPLRGLRLTELHCNQTRVADLSPLQGMPLTLLDVGATQVADLRPLIGAPLTWVICYETRVTNLAPLQGMPLVNLNIRNTEVSDLSPLRSAPLQGLLAGHTRISDLSPLKGMPLVRLGLGNSRVTSLAPLEGMSLRWLFCKSCEIADFSPLKGMPLELLTFDADPIWAVPFVKSFPTLKKVNDLPAAEFLKQAEANSKIDRDLRAAEWVLSIGGELEIAPIDAVKPPNRVKSRDELPADAFAVRSITLNESSRVTDVALKNLFGLRHLRSLHLIAADQLSAAGLDVLRSLPALQHLRLESMTLTNEAVARLVGMPDLRVLELRATSISDAGIDRLRALKRLRGLHFVFRPASDAMLESLSKMEHLRELTIRGSELRDEGLAKLASLTKLEKLDVGWNLLTGAGFKPFSASKLQFLIVQANSLTDDSLKLISRLKDLRILWVDDTPLTDATLPTLTAMNRLAMLELRGTRITDQGAKKLHTALAKCHLYWTNGSFLPEGTRDGTPPIDQFALRGEWSSVGEEVDGKAWDEPMVKSTNRRVTIRDNALTMTRTISGNFGTYRGEFQVNESSHTFDFTGKGPNGADVAFRGIYDLDGDTLRLCYKYVKGPQTARPTQFRTDNRAGTSFVLLVLRRVGDE